jgi:DNA mismatch repair protein MutL
VEHRGLNYALFEGYHTALMKGRYPVCCLFVEIDPAEVDVNVHPSKKEVRFRHEPVVREQVTQAVRECLLRYHASSTGLKAPLTAPASHPDPLHARTGIVPEPAPSCAPISAAPQALPHRENQAALFPPTPSGTELSPMGPTPFARRVRHAEPIAAAPAIGPKPTGEGCEPTASEGALLSIPLRLVGVVGNLYVLFESDRGLVLMDQHAAHERVLYEQMLDRLQRDGAASQRLLLPETVEVPPRDAQFLKENLAVLSRLGVGLSEFGERTFLLDALPPFVKVIDARRFVLELVDELTATGRDVNALRLGEHLVAKTVCRHAVKARDPLSFVELENLLSDLRRCAMPYTCPHGRPTLIELNYRELEKKFGRI